MKVSCKNCGNVIAHIRSEMNLGKPTDDFALAFYKSIGPATEDHRCPQKFEATEVIPSLFYMKPETGKGLLTAPASNEAVMPNQQDAIGYLTSIDDVTTEAPQP